MEESMLNISR